MKKELLELAAYWEALARFGERTICVWREYEGKPAIFRISEQASYKEWGGCFSLYDFSS